MDQFDELHGNTATTFLFAKKKKKEKRNSNGFVKLKRDTLISLIPCE